MDRVDLANLALSHVQQKPITLNSGESWESATSTNLAHQVVQEHFDPVRREALAAHGWGFATVRQALVQSSHEPLEVRWIYAYVYPADCLRFIRLVDPLTLDVPGARDARVSPYTRLGVDGYSLWYESSRYSKWEQGAVRNARGDMERIILANMERAVGVYVTDIEDIDLWSPRFVTAMTYLLAARIAPSLSKFAEGNRAFAVWMKVLGDAKVLDANESNPEVQQQADHIRARQGC